MNFCKGCNNLTLEIKRWNEKTKTTETMYWCSYCKKEVNSEGKYV